MGVVHMFGIERLSNARSIAFSILFSRIVQEKESLQRQKLKKKIVHRERIHSLQIQSSPKKIIVIKQCKETFSLDGYDLVGKRG